MTADELPEGWELTDLQSLGTWSTGGTPSRKRPEFFGGPIPWIKSGDLPDCVVMSTEESITELALQSSNAKLLPKGTLAVALYGATIGKLGIFGIPAATNQACASCQVNSALAETMFLFYFLQEQRKKLIEAGQGGAQPNISNAIVREWLIPLPPLAEQRRIVAVVERILGAVTAARARLDRVPTTLKRFRQAVLAAACSGRLTADWRESAKQDTPPERFRADILHARDAAIGNRKGKTLAEADNDYLDELPPGWALFSLEELTTVITSGSRDWTKYYGNGTGTFIMAQNVRPGTLNLSTRQQVGPPANDRDAIRSQVATGDLLVTIVGANTGDLCTVDRALPEHYVCQSVALLRPVDGQMSPYLNLYFNTVAFGRGQFNRYIYGEGRPHLGFDQIKMSAVALPPLAEQQEIVRRVSALFARADAIEATVSAARKRVGALTQAVLAKAFRGELVPTEAEIARRENRPYESATDLLARLRAAPATTTAKPKRTRKLKS